ncbi:hypothetical protein [Nocardia transvalensis]|uniref:hypothetical protein n=1 Tax=Nocardia transvalensis TaxID=37333 RepID=UPI0018953736|nr:hypothetical protein [Nocardia transvalensis]MBF6329266.1 hypothetical protein [Nocardia transvalensis]
MRKLHISGLGAVIAATAGALIIAAPQAAANRVSLGIGQGLSNGYGTGCTYILTATADRDAHRTIFLDNGREIRGGEKNVSGNTVTQTWTPATPGQHVLTAKVIVGDLAETSISVQVGNGVNLGSACAVL